MRLFKNFVIILFLLNFNQLAAQEGNTYRLPPKEIADAINVPASPLINLSPDKDWMLLIDYGTGYSSIEKLAAPELRIAGLRINPLNNANTYVKQARNIRLKEVTKESSIINIKNLPDDPLMAFFSWSPDGKKIAFCQFLLEKVELWVIDVTTAKASKVTESGMNATFWNPYKWMPDGKSVICRVVLPGRDKVAESTRISIGPIIQKNEGEEVPSRTYQDLLKDAHDEALFDYYATSQLIQVGLDGAEKKIGKKGIILDFDISPNGRYVLIDRIHRPYSYLVKYYRFPLEVSIYDLQSRFAVQLHDMPLRESIPIGRDGVQSTPRGFAWRPDLPSTIYWIKAQDKGDPEIESEIRDKVFTLDAPFTEIPKEICRTGLRFDRIIWGNDTTAILIEKWWDKRKMVWIYLNPKKRKIVDTLFVYSSEDRYSHPGEPESIYNEAGRQVLFVQKDGSIFLLGQGASSEGDRPFVDNYNLNTKTKNRIWQSQAPYYETGIEMVDPKGKVVLTRKESKHENPNYFLRDIINGNYTQITFFPNPFHSLEKIQRQNLNYERADGVALTADLYLPEGYNFKMGPLPAFISAYPVEYKQKDAAGQVYGSPYIFVGLNSFSALLATQGYAVIDASFPIVAETNKAPNDTFIEQLIANAKAAIEEGVRMGVVDSSRVAIGGHSYGAFMVANLVTHSQLFKGGIALSGAYNRTLTPFGFQNENRTYWQAPELYNSMSPFHHADKMKSPLLLIHGRADNNAGTYILQSERYYNALKGLGATVRYVCLPYEGHTYLAIESIMHVYWETCRWLEKYVKNNSVSMKNQNTNVFK